MYESEKFIRGINRNIVIYDADAEPGKFTPHLFACMNTAARHIEGITSRIFRWHLPRVIIEEFMEKPSSLFHDVTQYNKYIMGLEWFEQPDDLFGGVTLTTKKGEPIPQNAWILPDDKYYVIGETDNGEYVIGSC